MYSHILSKSCALNSKWAGPPKLKATTTGMPFLLKNEYAYAVVQELVNVISTVA